MSASGDGPERLAEILREIIGLTKKACDPCGKQAGEERGEFD